MPIAPLYQQASSLALGGAARQAQIFGVVGLDGLDYLRCQAQVGQHLGGAQAMVDHVLGGLAVIKIVQQAKPDPNAGPGPPALRC
jgi:hypothetical protein